MPPALMAERFLAQMLTGEPAVGAADVVQRSPGMALAITEFTH